ncbi:MAG: hypothetical protein A2314_05250 [Elusimicrobia bacterium RIFOXYB2_FULL_50_12]|nr:MAG: hypothetical protein A2314_05250 [Elusimicrobia bacterium RIFOXYB2_FULL_50_12]
MVLTIAIFLCPAIARAQTYYMALNPGPGGEWGNSSNYNDGLAKANPFLTLQYAMSKMTSGDTLIIADGEYTTSNNTIWQFNYPPSGPGTGTGDERFTVIRAENIPGINGVPCNQPLKVKFSGDAKFSDQAGLAGPHVSWVKFWGIRWEGIGTGSYWDHIYFKQVASHGIADGNTTTFSITGQYNLLEDCIAFGKGRYKFLFYDNSRENQTRGPGNNLCRRCISRQDWAKKEDPTPDPIAGFCSYYNRGSGFLNCVIIDSDLPSEWMNDPTELAGAFYQPVDEGPHSMIMKGCIVVNTAMAAYLNRQGSSGHVIEDFAGIHLAGGLGLQGSTDADRVTLVDLGVDNFVYRSTTQVSTVLIPDDGVNSFRGDIPSTFHDSIISDTKDDGMDELANIANDYIQMYAIKGSTYSWPSSAQPPHFYYSNPQDDGLRYPLRIESNSALSSRGSTGGQIGARITHRLGIDGTFKGEPNWDTEQQVSLWPWPLEDWIKSEMKTSQYTPNPQRGFCAEGTGLNGSPITLTSYLWEYLGSPCPDEIYGSSDTTPPEAPKNLTIK